MPAWGLPLHWLNFLPQRLGSVLLLRIKPFALCISFICSKINLPTVSDHFHQASWLAWASLMDFFPSGEFYLWYKQTQTYIESNVQLQSSGIDSMSLRQNVELKLWLHIAYAVLNILHGMFYTSHLLLWPAQQIFFLLPIMASLVFERKVITFLALCPSRTVWPSEEFFQDCVLQEL